MKYKNIRNLLYGTPHMIRDGKLQEICSLIEARAEGEEPEFEDVVEQPQTQLLSAATGLEMASQSGNGNFHSGNLIAIVPLFGTMMQHSIVHDASGGTSTEQLSNELRRLDADPQVGSIVLEVHSPGGQVYGAFELAQQVRDLGTRVVSVANSEMASAALLVGTAADEVFGTTGASVGSIGVVTVHTDVSKAEQAAGISTTVIAEPPAKASGNPFEPLSQETLLEIQAGIRETYNQFKGFVAASRGVTPEAVEANYGAGRMLTAEQAFSVGLIDGIQTKQQVVDRERARIQSPKKSNNSNRLKLTKLHPHGSA